MAIIRHGYTPEFGVYKQESEALLIDSITFNSQTQSIDQTGNMGDVVGKIYFDQTVTFDVSGTVLYDEEAHTSVAMPWQAGQVAELANAAYYLPNVWNTGIKKAETPQISIIDTTSVSAAAGQGTTFSASGTVYKFEDVHEGSLTE
jgi:hypothetical protein